MRVFKPERRDEKGKQQPYRKWYVEFRDHLETVRRIPAFTDRKASEELGRKIEILVASRLAGEAPDAALTRWLETTSPKLRGKLCKIGLLDASRAAAGKPLTEHVSDWEKYLQSKGDTEMHIETSAARVLKAFAGCGFQVWSDISAGKIQVWLAERRETGMSSETSNHYLRALKGFCNWMVRDRRAIENPLRHIQTVNTKVDRRHDRRVLTVDEVRRLITAAQNGAEYAGMPGWERAILYRLAVETGLRANEIRTLTRNSFDFNADPPTVTVKAAYSKHRRDDTLPLRPETVQTLREFLSGKFPTAPLFSNMPARTGEMMQVDLEHAGIPYVDDSERFADFHSLRHTFITMLTQSGIHVKTCQSLARHSTITLTMDRYTAPALLETQSEAIRKLPDFSAAALSEKKAAGADNSSVAFCVPFRGGFSDTSVDFSGQKREGKPEMVNASKPSQIAGKRASASASEKMGRTRLELATPGFSVQCSTN